MNNNIQKLAALFGYRPVGFGGVYYKGSTHVMFRRVDEKIIIEKV